MSNCATRSRTCGIGVEALETRVLFTAVLPFSDPTAPVLMNHLDATHKGAKITESLPDGTPFTVQVKRGIVDVYHVDNRLQLAVTSSDTRTSVIVLGNPELAVVTVAGSIKTFTATSNNDAGSISIAGSVKKLILSSVGGSVSVAGNVGVAQLGVVTGTFAVGGTIGKLTVDTLNGATILSGTVLGANNVLGGGDDVNGPGEILSMKILGPVINSTVAVGTGPGADAIFGTADDVNAGGGGFKMLTITDGADANSHFEAATFGNVKISPYLSLESPKRLVNPLLDAHFRVPA